MVTRSRIALTFLFIVAVAFRASASPVLWQYTGEASFTGTSSIIPQGTQVEMDWWFDPDAAEQPGCEGYYPTATSAITFHLLGASFTAPSTGTFVNAGGFGIGCGPFPSGFELVWGGGAWSDASSTIDGYAVSVFGTPTLFSGLGGAYGGWGGPGLPTTPPLFLHFDGPTFIFPGPLPPYEWESMHVDLHPVPEPALMLLMAVGIAYAWRRWRIVSLPR